MQPCGRLKLLDMGKWIFLKLLLFADETEMNNKLIMYGKCENKTDACWVFDKMRKRIIGPWHLLMSAYVANWQR